jgi:hypothetical protein
MPKPHDGRDDQSDPELQARIEAADRVEAELRAAGIPREPECEPDELIAYISLPDPGCASEGRMTSPRRPPRPRGFVMLGARDKMSGVDAAIR